MSELGRGNLANFPILRVETWLFPNPTHTVLPPRMGFRFPHSNSLLLVPRSDGYLPSVRLRTQLQLLRSFPALALCMY